MAMPRVVVAEDQELMRHAIAKILQGRFTLVGTADNGRLAIELAQALNPDVLVLDISMPTLNGIEAASHLKEIGSTVSMVFLTAHDDFDFVEAAFSAGALGYVLKQFLATDLIPAIWAAIHGQSFVSRAVHAH